MKREKTLPKAMQPEAQREAQKAKDKQLIEKLNLEIRSIEFVARTGIHDHVVVPAVARLYTKKTGKPAPPPIPVKKPSLEELKPQIQQRIAQMKMTKFRDDIRAKTKTDYKFAGQ